MNLEITLMWITLAFYFVSTLMFVVGVVFTREKTTRQAFYVAAAGLVPQLAAVAVRWVRLGHGPYVGYYEVANALTLFTMVLFVAAALRNRRLVSIGVAVMPVSVLLLGGAMLSDKADIPITASLASYWLVIHVIFANMAFAAFVASFGLSIAYVLREKQGSVWVERLKALPDQLRVEDFSVRFVLAGFLLWGMMIVSGAIWAEESWGRYWSWDPIETWSLIVWLIYAVFLHLRYTMRWKGTRLAWFSIISMPIALFCLIGIPTVYNTIHAGYIGGIEGQLW